MKRLAFLALLPLALGARADEGMWTFEDFPADAVTRAHGFRPDRRWLDAARLSSVRIAQGCSGSFVSGGGLVMTNHHCAQACLEQLSTGGRDLVRDGFQARTAAEEVRCPALELNQLLGIEDVTGRIREATAGLEGKAYAGARRAEMARLERACQTSDALRCEVVILHAGARYDLYRYRRFQDVRLVFAPEIAIAFFGGDPDNFNFPRWDLDVAFLRAYADGKPAATPEHLRWSRSGAAEGELTFVSGHPARTSRRFTVAQLEDERDRALPSLLVELAERRGRLAEYRHRGPEQARHSGPLLHYVENSFKARSGMLRALRDEAFFGKAREEEARLRAALAADPARAKRTLPAFGAIAEAQAAAGRLAPRLRHVEGASSLAVDQVFRSDAGYGGQLFRIARTLVRGPAEREKPDGARLREYQDARLPALAQSLFSPAPIHPEFEAFQLGFGLEKMREALGADDPFVVKALGREAPAALAKRLVQGTALADVAVRRRLWEGGRAAVEAAAGSDPLLAWVLRLDPDARAVRRSWDEEIEPVLARNAEILARGRFEVFGASAYPDATFTLRLSYGTVKGWVQNGKPVAPFTTFAGALARHTGSEPFALPRSWLEARERLDPNTPFDLVTTNDIIGGNSGSPLFDRDLQVVGVVFDGNIWSLGGSYGFDESKNRCVAVDSRGLLEALRTVYRADRLVEELGVARMVGR